MFQFPTFPFICYFTYIWITRLLPLAEFPHSDIHVLTVICTYAWLFAACHVLLRLLMPRHSPCALLRLNSLCISWIQPFSCLNCCVSHLQFFASGKIVFYPSGKTWFLKSCLFPLLFTVRVLSSILSYKWLHFLLIRFSMSSPAFIRLLNH